MTGVGMDGMSNGVQRMGPLHSHAMSVLIIMSVDCELWIAAIFPSIIHAVPN